jgi:hypothetical protein
LKNCQACYIFLADEYYTHHFARTDACEKKRERVSSLGLLPYGFVLSGCGRFN